MPEPAARTATRILERLDALPGTHGVAVDRSAFSEAHAAARRRLVAWGADIGLRPALDAVGNLWLQPSTTRPRTLLLGSHLDSVPNGGRFDGAMGVLIALEVAGRAAMRGGVTVVDFIAEESSRFGVGTVGSSVLAGKRALDDAFALRDHDGASFEALRSAHLTELATAPSPAAEAFDGYLEVHVDQAADLVRRDAEVGVVDTIAAPTRWTVRCTGQQAHAGAAAMAERHDALTAAAAVVLKTEALARSATGTEVRATVGRIDVEPNAVNVVPGVVELEIDLRSLDASSAAWFEARLSTELAALEAARGVRCELRPLMHDIPAAMASRLRAALSEAADDLGIHAASLPSWPSHDALHVATLIPAGLLLVRNVGGVSHSPAEAVTLDDLTSAFAVVERTVGALTGARGEVIEP